MKKEETTVKAETKKTEKTAEQKKAERAERIAAKKAANEAAKKEKKGKSSSKEFVEAVLLAGTDISRQDAVKKLVKKFPEKGEGAFKTMFGAIRLAMKNLVSPDKKETAYSLTAKNLLAGKDCKLAVNLAAKKLGKSVSVISGSARYVCRVQEMIKKGEVKPFVKSTSAKKTTDKKTTDTKRRQNKEKKNKPVIEKTA